MSETKTDPWMNVRTFDYTVYGNGYDKKDFGASLGDMENQYQRWDYTYTEEVDAALAAERAAHAAALAHAEHEQQTVIDATKAHVDWLKSQHTAALAEKDAKYEALRNGIAGALCVENPNGPVEDAVLIEQADQTLSQLFDECRAVTEARTSLAEKDAEIARLKAECDSHISHAVATEREVHAAYTRGEAAGLREGFMAGLHRDYDPEEREARFAAFLAQRTEDKG